MKVAAKGASRSALNPLRPSTISQTPAMEAYPFGSLCWEAESPVFEPVEEP